MFLSRKYLESEFCLYELNGIWKEAGQDGDRFLRRVIPLILPDANLKNTEDLLTKSDYWTLRWQKLKEQITQNLDTTGVDVFAKCKDIQEFSHQIGSILALLTDKCEPRDFDRQSQEGFREVIAQIRAVRQG
jgi:internalin A